MPTADRRLTADYGETGATLFVAIEDRDGTEVAARSSSGVSESPAGSGLYVVSKNLDTAGDPHRVVWDDGSGWFAVASSDWRADAIAAKTDLIVSGGVNVVGKVVPGGKITIEIGTDDVGTGKITLTELAVGDWDHDSDAIAASTFLFRAEHSGSGASASGQLEVGATLNAADENGLRSFSVEIPATSKPSRSGQYYWSVAADLGGGPRPIAGGILVLSAGAWTHAA